MNTNKSPNERSQDELSKYAAGMKSGVDGAIDGAHDAAHDLMSTASEKIDSLRDEVKPAVDRWVARGEQMASSAIAGTRETGARAKRAVTGYVNACESYVVEQPMKSVAIAAAAGAAIAALVMLSRGHSHRVDRR
jgi:ElaB/YqjD/DUF883 family membrane-anchored ribosome-binding protein